jgi:DNA-binding NarL/FixJ family response regulator
MQINHIAIVDDHEIFRKGLKMVLSKLNFIDKITECTDGSDFLEKLEQDTSINLVLMDIEMPKLNGIETTKAALKKQPDLKIIALSMYKDAAYIQSMMDAGVKGFLIKNISKPILEKALINIIEGGVYYSEELWDFFTNQLNKEKQQGTDTVHFTKREIEILKLLYEGMTNKEIADELFVSERTIIGHKTNLLSKTGCKNAIGLISYALKNKVIEV